MSMVRARAPAQNPLASDGGVAEGSYRVQPASNPRKSLGGQPSRLHQESTADRGFDSLLPPCESTNPIASQGLDEGFRVVVNDGAQGCQTVYHLHLHVIVSTVDGEDPFFLSEIHGEVRGGLGADQSSRS